MSNPSFVNWRLRLWIATFFAVLAGAAMAVLLVTAHHYGGVPVMDVATVWDNR